MLKRAISLGVLLTALAGPTLAQQKALTEAEAFTAVKLATNPTTKVAAAEEFVARFPQSASRLKVAELVAAEIGKVKDGEAAITLVERAQVIFTAKEERALFQPVALEAFVKGDRADDAFEIASELLARKPNDLHVLALMAGAGAEQAKKRERKHVDTSLQYGLKAIALIEANNKPSEIDHETWSAHKTKLGTLYQQTAILYLSLADTEEAKVRLTKAAELQSDEPSNFALLGRVLNAEYLEQMKAYEAMRDGNVKQETLKKVEALLDRIIDAYARAAGLATGRAQYQTLLQQVIPDLTSYYKQRHNQSTTGLQELINKYRR